MKIIIINISYLKEIAKISLFVVSEIKSQDCWILPEANEQIVGNAGWNFARLSIALVL